MAKWQWMRKMLARVQEAKRQGKPMPQSIEDMERTVGGALSSCNVSDKCSLQLLLLLRLT